MMSNGNDEQSKKLGFDTAFKNLEIAQDNYGEESIYCLSYYLAALSSSISVPKTYQTSNINAENILGKMMRVLKEANQLAPGNHLFYMAATIIGII
jgi:tetratricopeptide (TPR) repeat protein